MKKYNVYQCPVCKFYEFTWHNNRKHMRCKVNGELDFDSMHDLVNPIQCDDWDKLKKGRVLMTKQEKYFND